jgi:hypothetical protein
VIDENLPATFHIKINIHDDTDCTLDREQSGSRLYDYFEDGSYVIFIFGIVYDPSLESELGIVDSEILKFFLMNNTIEQKAEGFQGNFFIYLHDIKNEKKYFLNDPVGLCTVFFREDNEQIFLSNDPYLHKFEASLNLQNLERFVKNGYGEIEDTFYDGFEILASDHFFKLEKGNLHKIKRKVTSDYSRISFDISVGEFYSILNMNTSRLVKRFSPEILLLSGGADSRLTLYCLNSQQKSDINAITYLSSNISSDQDVVVAKKLCAQFGLQHKVHDARMAYPKNKSPVYNERSCRFIDRIALTGLYGSELLGDALSCAYPTNSLESYDFKTKILYKSYMTSVYAKNNAHQFLFPYLNMAYGKVSPFYDSFLYSFLKSAFLENELTEFKIYKYVYSRIVASTALDIPLVSKFEPEGKSKGHSVVPRAAINELPEWCYVNSNLSLTRDQIVNLNLVLDWIDVNCFRIDSQKRASLKDYIISQSTVR